MLPIGGFYPDRQGIRFLPDRQLVLSSTYQMFRLGNAAHGKSWDGAVRRDCSRSLASLRCLSHVAAPRQLSGSFGRGTVPHQCDQLPMKAYDKGLGALSIPCSVAPGQQGSGCYELDKYSGGESCTKPRPWGRGGGCLLPAAIRYHEGNSLGRASVSEYPAGCVQTETFMKISARGHRGTCAIFLLQKLELAR